MLDRPYDTVRADMTVQQALEVLRASGARRTRTVYVVDRARRLVGRVDMQAMAMADADQRLSELLDNVDASVLATAPRSEVVELLDRYRVDSLPVVDVEGRLLGVVRYQALFETIEAVATESLQKMVGVSADERALSAPSFSVRRRLPWLHINLLTAFLAAAVVGAFESLIAQFTALAVLLPVVAGQSGNAGSQALAVTMRGLALREIHAGMRRRTQFLYEAVALYQRLDACRFVAHEQRSGRRDAAPCNQDVAQAHNECIVAESCSWKTAVCPAIEYRPGFVLATEIHDGRKIRSLLEALPR